MITGKTGKTNTFKIPRLFGESLAAFDSVIFL